METLETEPHNRLFPLSRYLPLFVRLAVYSYALNRFSYITADPDLWGHIRFGREIWEQGAIPRVDTFSYTAAGQTWINHEWLTEVLFFLIHDHLGSTGLLVFKLLAGLLAVHLLSAVIWRAVSKLNSDGTQEPEPASRTTPSMVYGLCFFLVIPVMAPGFMTRPHLMSIVFLAVLTALLHKYTALEKTADGPGPLVWVPLLMLVWANSHGGVVAGMGILGMTAFIEGVRWRAGKTPSGHWLVPCFALSCLAVLLNPYGYKLWTFFFHSIGRPRVIGEWTAVPLWSADFWQYKMLAALFIFSLFVPGKKRAWEVAVITLALIYGFRHQRHSVLAAVVLAPYLTIFWTRILETPANGKSLVPGLSKHFFILLPFLLGGFILFQLHNALFIYRSNHFKILVEPNVYPSHLARFMKLNGIDGKLVVPFDWGEYFIWKRPASKVSIDGRFRTVYPQEIIEMNRDFERGGPGWKRLLEAYPPDLIITGAKEEPARALDRDGGWKKIYQDPVSRLYVRNGRRPDPLLEKFYRKELVDSKEPPSYEFP